MTKKTPELEFSSTDIDVILLQAVQVAQAAKTVPDFDRSVGIYMRFRKQFEPFLKDSKLFQQPSAIPQKQNKQEVKNNESEVVKRTAKRNKKASKTR